ncbi:MAG TPA: hypothetical protein VMT43_00985 [Acidimicrobiales bacterium]|nr:hypothetical protein [Acidimicrobiales bacterium]
MAFIQIVDFETSKLDEMLALDREWEAASAGTRTTGHRVLARDRDNPDRYLNIVWFDSFESAMENSNLPVTQAFAEKMMALSKGGATFVNLDVIEEIEG